VVEGVNAMLKGTFVNIQHKFFRRVFGLAKITLLLAFTVADYNLEAIRSFLAKVGERTAARPEEDLPASAERLLDRLLKAGKSARHAGPMLVAKLGRREATLDHRHQRLAVTAFEDELGLVLDARTVGPALGRVEEEATWPVDHPEEVVAVELVARGPERHGPDPAHAKIALGLDDPARFT
jgi:hypothetical protein